MYQIGRRADIESISSMPVVRVEYHERKYEDLLATDPKKLEIRTLHSAGGDDVKGKCAGLKVMIFSGSKSGYRKEVHMGAYSGWERNPINPKKTSRISSQLLQAVQQEMQTKAAKDVTVLIAAMDSSREAYFSNADNFTNVEQSRLPRLAKGYCQALADQAREACTAAKKFHKDHPAWTRQVTSEESACQIAKNMKEPHGVYSALLKANSCMQDADLVCLAKSLVKLGAQLEVDDIVRTFFKKYEMKATMTSIEELGRNGVHQEPNLYGDLLPVAFVKSLLTQAMSKDVRAHDLASQLLKKHVGSGLHRLDVEQAIRELVHQAGSLNLALPNVLYKVLLFWERAIADGVVTDFTMETDICLTPQLLAQLESLNYLRADPQAAKQCWKSMLVDEAWQLKCQRFFGIFNVMEELVNSGLAFPPAIEIEAFLALRRTIRACMKDCDPSCQSSEVASVLNNAQAGKQEMDAALKTLEAPQRHRCWAAEMAWRQICDIQTSSQPSLVKILIMVAQCAEDNELSASYPWMLSAAFINTVKWKEVDLVELEWFPTIWKEKKRNDLADSPDQGVEEDRHIGSLDLCNRCQGTYENRSITMVKSAFTELQQTVDAPMSAQGGN